MYLAIPPHCLFGAPATNSTQIWSLVNSSLPSLSFDLDGKPTFGFSHHTSNNNLFKVGNYLGRCACPCRERTENIFEKDIWVPHVQQILDNCTLPIVGAPCIISQEMKVFQRIAFPKIKTQRSNNSRQCRVKQSGDPNIPQDVWEYLRFNPLPF